MKLPRDKYVGFLTVLYTLMFALVWWIDASAFVVGVWYGSAQVCFVMWFLRYRSPGVPKSTTIVNAAKNPETTLYLVIDGQEHELKPGESLVLLSVDGEVLL